MKRAWLNRFWRLSVRYERNAEISVGSVPITREQFDSYLPYFEAPRRAELDLFDNPAVASTDM
jgi:hypothetical protein